jgi:cell division protein FtsB
MSLEVIYHLRQEIKAKDQELCQLKKANQSLLKEVAELKKTLFLKVRKLTFNFGGLSCIILYAETI